MRITNGFFTRGVVVLGAASLTWSASAVAQSADASRALAGADIGLSAAAAALAALPAHLAASRAALAQLPQALSRIDQTRDLRGLRALRGMRALRDLRGLESLSGLESLRGLESLERLESLNSLGSLESLESLKSLGDLDAVGTFHSFDASGSLEFSGGDDQVADSLYRSAREAMKRGDYKRAASMFDQVVQRHPKAGVAGDAMYWQAYALYRSGGSSDLSSALVSLDRMSREYPKAATLGDANTLRIRVCGELAKRGDERCALQVTKSADGPKSSASAGQGQQSCPADNDDDDERIAALNALLQMDSDRALPILERVLARRDKCSVALRRKAVFLVSQKADSKAVDILMNAIRNDPDREVREQAVFWLGQTRDDRAVDMLQEILAKETNDDILDKAVFALSQHRSSKAGTILRDLAQRNGAPLKVREQAIFWLGQKNNGENADLLKNLYKQVKEDELKEKIIFSISQNHAAANDRWLMDLALDSKEDMEMRKKALFWAGQNRSTSITDLAALYDRMNDRDIKEQLIFVYSQRKESAAVDKLLDIAKNDKDKELRKKAVFWLSQSRDPRIAKFLEDLIG